MATKKQKRAAERRAQKRSERAAAEQRKANQQKAKGKGKAKVQSRPPAGYYDPNLDAAERAANRGLGDLVADTATGRGRAATDFTLGQTDLKRQRTELGEDIATQRQAVEQGYGRNLSDLLTERRQAGEDYTSNLAALQRNYERLGSAQTQSARAAGVAAGGALAQAAAKRAANQAIEKAPIDTGFKRFTDASKLSETRLGEDRNTSLAALLRAETRGQGALDRTGGTASLDYQRGLEDLTTTLARAQRENTAFGMDTNAARIAQATQAGWNPNPLPGKSPVKKKGGGGRKVGTVKKKRKTGLGALL